MSFLNIRDVGELLGLSENEVKERVKTDPSFPRPVKPTPRSRTNLFVKKEVSEYAEGMRIISSVAATFVRMIERAPQIVDSAICVSGVYVLFHEHSIIYVGQSVNVHARLRQHQQDGKNFDSARVIPCPKEELNNWEGFLIRLLRPPLNGRPDHAPVSEIWNSTRVLIGAEEGDINA